MFDMFFIYDLQTHTRYAPTRRCTLGYAKTRSHFRYDKRGDLVETRFPVWTEKGQEYIKEMIKGKDRKNLNSKN
jgi:hypothetical protein